MKSSATSAPAQANAAERAGAAGPRAPEQVLAADVGDDEDVEHHHRAGVDDDLRRGDELGAQQHEEHGERDQMDDEREHAVEGVLERDHADRPRERLRSRR